ncbi:putative 2-pyrone-4,6-dicarboxylic acid hydrolase domain protein [Bordetella holmesii 35009]|nr:putative 2-pyrone-4,6-dicarboxylic acid hydrolase domain protein [Bordetella holmesii 35009]
MRARQASLTSASSNPARRPAHRRKALQEQAVVVAVDAGLDNHGSRQTQRPHVRAQSFHAGRAWRVVPLGQHRILSLRPHHMDMAIAGKQRQPC